jgi:N-acetylneuraminate synthase
MKFELVRHRDEDALQVMEWRNDPETLRFSFHTDPKTWPEFAAEFNDYFLFPELPPLFAVEEGARVAFIRFEPVADPYHVQRHCCSISINVAPNWRGKGIGTALLKEIQPWVLQQGYESLYAEIKRENAASHKAFVHAGFQILKEDVKILPETGKEIPIISYYLELSKSNKNADHVKIVAEAGSNWRMGTPERDWEMAKRLIDIAIDAGADAVKFQLFRPETIYVPNAGSSDYLSKKGINTPITELFSDLMMPYEMVEKLYRYCLESKIEFMSSAFSVDDFSVVDPFVRCHKIASYEIGHLHLLKMAAASKKPLLLSTGAATIEEIAWAVDTFRQNEGQSLTLMQCTACYSPAPSSSMNLGAIPYLRKRFAVNVGLSDHSRHPITAPVAAVALGAVVIEKHFTLDNRLPGPDHSFAVEPDELKQMVIAVKEAKEMLGAPIKIVDDAEQELRLFACRGIQAIRAIPAGDIFSEGDNIAILRPGKQKKGIHPRFLEKIEGRHAARDIPLGDGIKQGDYA